MNLTMNGPVAQILALGTIAAVAFFPAPEDLRAKLGFGPEPVPTVIELPEHETAMMLDVPESREMIVIESPIRLDCIPERSANNVEGLDSCVFELATYIKQSPHLSLLTETDAEPRLASFPDPQIEEARRALALLCQTKWGLDQYTPEIAAACDEATP